MQEDETQIAVKRPKRDQARGAHREAEEDRPARRDVECGPFEVQSRFGRNTTRPTRPR
jgi:hypothetical protein